MKVLIFSKTSWDEAPRIRHQLSWLLKELGAEVHFVQRCSRFGTAMEIKKEVEPDIFVYRHSELFYHQLRPTELFHKLNAAYCRRFIKRIYKIVKPDLIVNFNYDYFFLKDEFDIPIITVINDDFIAAAKPWMKKSALSVLRGTCEMSEKVLVVSYMLEQQVQAFTDKVSVLLPWASERYQQPPLQYERDTLLYFGFINYRLDWLLIKAVVAKGVKVRFIGPVEGQGAESHMQDLEEYSNFEYLPAQPLDKVNFDDVFASFVPFDAELEQVQAITVNNRVFQLLARGIPIIYRALPYLIHAKREVVHTYCDINECLEEIEHAKKSFAIAQSDIREFVSANTKHSRKKLLLDVMAKAMKNNDL